MLKTTERNCAMIIKNAKVFTPEFKFENKEIGIKDSRFIEVQSLEPAQEKVIDAGGLYAIPGLIDIHFHGAVGHDFCDGTFEAIDALARFEASHGVLAICPATMTFSEDILNNIMDAASSYCSKQKGILLHDGQNCADLVGINMEGPFISPNKVGAQNPKYLHAPDAEMFKRLQKRSSGLIKLVDIAPEEDGAIEMIKECKNMARFSIAHTCASYEDAIDAFDAGASHMTHLYNAMPGITHRAPGPIVAAQERKAEVELISDGVHSHPAVVAFTFRVFGADRVILIADSMMACGLEDGQYSLGGQAVTVNGSRAVLTEFPDTIAGSATDLFNCMRYAVLKAGVPLEDAVRAATYNPAHSIKIDTDYGSIEPNKYANLLLVDKELNIKAIYNHGIKIA